MSILSSMLALKSSTRRPTRTSTALLQSQAILPSTSLRRTPTCQRRTLSTSPEESNNSQDYDFGNYSVILPEEPFVFGTSHIKLHAVPKHIHRPPYIRMDSQGRDISIEADFSGDPWKGDGLIKLGSNEEERVRRAGQLAKDVLKYAGSLVKPGATTSDIDALVHRYIISHNAYPSPLLYSGFPKSCTTSVNNIICHGIPDERPLEPTDIVNIDITVYINGYHGDTSRTFAVSPETLDIPGRHLLETTEGALEAGISLCGPGRPFKDIGKAIHHYVQRQSRARSMDMCVNTQFTGHGIGTVFHRPPWILHYLNDEPGVMLPGHCFTIEPAIVQGANPRGWLFPDGWTVSTENCARSAQAEHMVLITEHGFEVLTV